MQKLFRTTPLQDSFPCNFNVLIAGMPRVMGIAEILEEWTAWRTDCVMEIIEQVCKSRKQITAAPSSMGSMGGMPGAASYPVEVTVGGATVFVMSVDQFVKL